MHLCWLFVAVGLVGVVLAVTTISRLFKHRGTLRTLIISPCAVFLVGVMGIVAGIALRGQEEQIPTDRRMVLVQLVRV